MYRNTRRESEAQSLLTSLPRRGEGNRQPRFLIAGLLSCFVAVACVAVVRSARADDQSGICSRQKRSQNHRAHRSSVKASVRIVEISAIAAWVGNHAGQRGDRLFSSHPRLGERFQIRRSHRRWRQRTEIRSRRVVPTAAGPACEKRRVAEVFQRHAYRTLGPGHIAARRDQCDWDLPIREMNISTPIPELIKLRDLGRIVAFKARIEMSRGQIDNAIETIQTGMAIGHHASQSPTLISALVGGAITNHMLDQVRELIQQPKCPNLYWTLTALPHPIMDTRLGMGMESDFVYGYLPELRGVRTAVHSEAEWNGMSFDVAKKMIDAVPGVAGQPKDLAWYGMGAMFATAAYPKAKRNWRMPVIRPPKSTP